MDSLLIFSLFLLFIGALFHVAGIYAISKSRDKSGYGAILINLSVSQLLIIVQQSIEIVARLTMKSYTGTIIGTMVEILWYIGGPESIITMLIMLLDRVMLVISPFVYKDSGKRAFYLVVALVSSWTFSLILALTLIATKFERTRDRLFITYICVTSLYIALTVISYSIIISKVNQRQQCQHAINGFNSHRLYRMTGVMVGSCILLNFLPMCLYAYRPEWEVYTDMVYFINLILDPCIYIFYNTTYRLALLPRVFQHVVGRKGGEANRLKQNSFDIYFITDLEESREISVRNFLSFEGMDRTGCGVSCQEIGCGRNDIATNVGADNLAFASEICNEIEQIEH